MDRLQSFFADLHKMLADEESVSWRIEQGRELVSDLASEPGWFFDHLEKMVREPALFKRERPGVWPNEYTLYRSPDKSFVVLVYVWGARLADTIHDHGSWGVVGTLLGTLGETKYERLDGGTRSGFCELGETASSILSPGETTPILPLNQGLHAMHNLTDGIAASINVYGKSIGRGYTQFFDPAKHTVTRVFPPLLAKEVLAAEALVSIDPQRAEDVIRQALGTPRPTPVRKEYEEALRRLRA